MATTVTSSPASTVPMNQLPLVSLCETVAKINMPTIVQAQPPLKVSSPSCLVSTGTENVFKVPLNNGEIHPIQSTSVSKIGSAVTLTVSRELNIPAGAQKPIIVTVSGMPNLGTGKQMTSATNVLTAPLLSAPIQMIASHFATNKLPANSNILTLPTIPRSVVTTGTPVLATTALSGKPRAPLIAAGSPLVPGSIITSKGLGQLPMMIASPSNSYLSSPVTSVGTTMSSVTLSNNIVTVTPVLMTSVSAPASIAPKAAIAINPSTNAPQVLAPLIQGTKVPIVATCKNILPAFVKQLTIAPASVQTVAAPQIPQQQLQPPPPPPAPTTPPALPVSLSADEPSSVQNPKSDPTNPDFDPVQAMEWKDGVGTLPGSDIKFKMNEFGALEIITDEKEVECENSVQPAKETGEETGTRSALKESYSKMKEMYKPENPVPVDENGTDDSRTDVSTELCRCENCDCFGLKMEFYKSGRFCSQACLNAFSNKKPLWLKKGTGKESRRRKRLKSTETDEEAPAAKDSKLDRIEEEKKINMKKEEDDDNLEEFLWAEYLKKEKALSASVKLFNDSQSFPTCKNGFEVGMKLEGIDPKHPSLFCALSVAEIHGFRIRLHFDGYSDRYDFWVNADSPDIFPVGWCEKTGHKLQLPKGFSPEEFTWDTYLGMAKEFVPAPKHLFSANDLKAATPHGFRLGMKLEAVDKKNTSLVCVSTVSDVMDNRFLIHFDGWEDIYDYWAAPNSPFIHPVNWCKENGHELTPPKDFKDESFCWMKYLNETRALAVPPRAYKQCSSNSFKAGMKIEAVDKRNPSFIRPATIVDRTDHTLLIHFDGWSSAYDYWVDDDCPDIHPIYWCKKTGYQLERIVDSNKAPSAGGCPTPGCCGLGHIKGPRHTSHHSSFGCPYSQLNINKQDTLFQDRISVSKDMLCDIPKAKLDQVSATDGLRRCPTPGCSGAGHVKGKYSVHHGISGCPLAAQQDVSIIPAPSSASSTRNSSSAASSSSSVNVETKSQEYLRTRNSPIRGRKKKLLGTGMRGRPPKALVLLRAQQAAQKKKQEEDSKPVIIKEEKPLSFDTPIVSAPKEKPIGWSALSKLVPLVRLSCCWDVKAWTVDEVAKFVTLLTKNDDLSKVFVDQIIDGEAFILLSQEDIINLLQVKLGPALKIFNSIAYFRSCLVSVEDRK